jgi:hypothetical protein
MAHRRQAVSHPGAPMGKSLRRLVFRAVRLAGPLCGDEANDYV